jgi:hypothetical protein
MNPFHADEVAEVQQFLEDLVVHRLVLAGGDLVAVDVDLLVAGGIAQHGEAGLAHHTHAHQAAGEHHDWLRAVAPSGVAHLLELLPSPASP